MAVLFGKPIVLTLRTFPSPIRLFCGLLQLRRSVYADVGRPPTSTVAKESSSRSWLTTDLSPATLPSKYEPLILAPVPVPIVFKIDFNWSLSISISTLCSSSRFCKMSFFVCSRHFGFCSSSEVLMGRRGSPRHGPFCVHSLNITVGCRKSFHRLDHLTELQGCDTGAW